MEKLPKITVITVVYNAVDDLKKTFESVFSQTYSNVEYIVIDGGSTDGTVDLIEANQEKISYWVSEADSGIYDAMNKGMCAATGDYINYMNAGDVFYLADTLKQLFCGISDGSDLILGNHQVLYHGSRIEDRCVNKSFRLDKVPLYMPVCHQSLFIKRYVANQYKFDLSYRLAADFNQLCSALKGGRSIQVVDIFVSIVSAYGLSDLKRLDVWSEYENIYNDVFGCNMAVSLFYFFRKKIEVIKCVLKRMSSCIVFF